MRITIGPILFLPAPPPLLRFYRERFQRMKAKHGSGPNGSGNRNGGFGSFTNSSAVGNLNVSPEGTQVGSRFGTTGESSVTRCSHDLNHESHLKYQEPTQPTGARFKLFNSRPRGPSVDSSRVLSKDFECESYDSRHLSESHGDSMIILDSVGSDREKKTPHLLDPHSPPPHPLSHQSSSSRRLMASSDTLQLPEPAFTVQQHMQVTRKEPTVANWRTVENMPKSPVRTREPSESSIILAQGSSGGMTPLTACYIYRTRSTTCYSRYLFPFTCDSQ